MAKGLTFLSENFHTENLPSLYHSKIRPRAQKVKNYTIIGKHPVLEAIKSKRNKVSKVYILEQNLSEIKKLKYANYKIVKKNFFSKITQGKDYLHQGYAAKITSENHDIKTLIKSQKNIVLLDGLNDQRNQGAILRNCLAFNVKDVVIEKKNYIEDNLSMHLASSGASMKLNIYTVSNLNNLIKDLKKNNFWIYGLDASANKSIEGYQFNKNNSFP